MTKPKIKAFIYGIPEDVITEGAVIWGSDIEPCYVPSIFDDSYWGVPNEQLRNLDAKEEDRTYRSARRTGRDYP